MKNTQLPDIIDFITKPAAAATQAPSKPEENKIAVANNKTIDDDDNPKSQTLKALLSTPSEKQIYIETYEEEIIPNKNITEKGASQSLFHQSPEDFWEANDDIPDDEELLKTDAKETIKNLLLPSEDQISDIKKYIINENIPEVSFLHPLSENENMFTIGGKSYLLKEEKHIKNIYQIIVALRESTTLIKTLKKRPSLLESIKTVLKKYQPEFKNDVLKTMTITVTSTIITKALSLSLNHSLAEAEEKLAVNANIRADSYLDDDKDGFEEKTGTIKNMKKKEHKVPQNSTSTNKLSFLKSTLASKLGFMLFETYIYLNHIYKAQEVIQQSSKEEEDDDEMHKRQEFDKLTDLEIMELITQLKSTPITDGKQKLNLAVASYLSLYLKAKPNTTLRNLDIEQTEKHQSIFTINIGLEIIEILKNIGALTETRSKENHPRLILAKQFEAELYASASHFKPLLTPFPVEDIKHKVTRKNFEIILDLNNNPIPNKGSVQITSTDALLDIISYAGAIPYAINEGNFNFFIEVFTNATLLSSKDDQALAYIKAIYNIDIKEFSKHNNDSSSKEIIEALIKYGLDLMEPRDESLYSLCQNHIGFMGAFHKMRSYKYFYKGFFNDINLYKNFKKFYIPKYLTSTGRLFSKSFYLQFQGNKLAKALMCFVQQQPLTTDATLEEVNNIIKSHLPGINTKLYVPAIARYDSHIKGLFNEQIKAMLNDNANPDLYPIKGTGLEQLLWLTANCKKASESFYVRALLHGVLNGNIYNLPYEKDATSSGSQIIAKLMRDSIFAKRVNVAGNEYHDLYADVTKTFITELKNIRTFTEVIFDRLFGEPFNETGSPINNTTPLAKILNTSLNMEEFLEIYKKEHKKLTLDQEIKIVDIKIPVLLMNAHRINHENNPVYHALSTIRNLLKKYKLLCSLPPQLLNRKLFKHIVMAYGYCQGSRSREHTFKELICNHYKSCGYPTIPLAETILNELTKELNSFFVAYATNHLSTVKDFLYCMHEYAKQSKNKVQAKYQFLSWELIIYKQSYSRHKFYIDKVTHNFQLNFNHGIDKHAINTTLPSIFIQGLDAHIVHMLYYILKKINQKLRAAGLCEIQIYTNHDNFAINAQYAHFLIPIMQQIYDTIDDLALEIPGLNKEILKPVKCRNPNVLQH